MMGKAVSERTPPAAAPVRTATIAMAQLILVKHASPQITPDVASPRWVLSAEGRERCAWLADRLGEQGVTALYSSLEPKALETAALVAVRLGLEVRPRADLHENDRTGLAFGSVEDLHARIRRFFEAPSDAEMGNETAERALARFEAAVRAVVAEAPGGTAAVIAHGTVLTLLVSRYNRIAPFAFWNGLTLPSYVVLDGADFSLSGTANNYPG